jgi:hypothetical protein
MGPKAKVTEAAIARRRPAQNSPRPATPIEEWELSDLVIELVMRALRVDDDRLNAFATEVVARCGPGIVRRLVLTVANRKQRPGHRVRLLRAIPRVLVIPDAANCLDLFSLTAD